MICSAYNLPCGRNLNCHEPKEVISCNTVNIFFDQVLSTDLDAGANRPDLIIKDKVVKKTYILDVFCPCDLNIHKAEATKVAEYVEWKGQLQQVWGFDCIIIPIIVGGLRAVTHNLKDYLAMIPGRPNVTLCQKITLLGSKKILSDILSRRR